MVVRSDSHDDNTFLGVTRGAKIPHLDCPCVKRLGRKKNSLSKILLKHLAQY